MPTFVLFEAAVSAEVRRLGTEADIKARCRTGDVTQEEALGAVGRMGNLLSQAAFLQGLLPHDLGMRVFIEAPDRFNQLNQNHPSTS